MCQLLNIKQKCKWKIYVLDYWYNTNHIYCYMSVWLAYLLKCKIKSGLREYFALNQ